MKTTVNLLKKMEEYRSTKLQSIEFLISTYGFFTVISFIFAGLVRGGIINI